MDPNLRTLSLAEWMSLPGLDFGEWDRRYSCGDSAVAAASRCRNCEALRAKAAKKHKNNDYVDSGALSCSKCVATAKKDGRKTAVVSPETTAGGLVPRRNLSLQRLQSKEVETRAKISRVAEYYESYVTEMGLNKYFINNAIVTCVAPIRICQENFNGKFKGAKWIVSG